MSILLEYVGGFLGLLIVLAIIVAVHAGYIVAVTKLIKWAWGN